MARGESHCTFLLPERAVLTNPFVKTFAPVPCGSGAFFCLASLAFQLGIRRISRHTGLPSIQLSPRGGKSDCLLSRKRERIEVRVPVSS